MRCLESGQCKSEVIVEFEGDKQLVDMWMSFLLHNKWMEKTIDEWVVTEKGREWKSKYTK